MAVTVLCVVFAVVCCWMPRGFRAVSVVGNSVSVLHSILASVSGVTQEDGGTCKRLDRRNVAVWDHRATYDPAAAAPWCKPSFLMLFLYLFTSLLVYFLTYLSTSSRIDPFHSQAGGPCVVPGQSPFPLIPLFPHFPTFYSIFLLVSFACLFFHFLLTLSISIPAILPA